METETKWTGAAIAAECAAQGLSPLFKDNVFIAYRDRHTGKHAITSMPPLEGKLIDEYVQTVLLRQDDALVKTLFVGVNLAIDGGDNTVTVPVKKASLFTKYLKPKKGGNALKKIRVLVKENPKQGDKAKRFALYKDGMAVNEYLSLGGIIVDIRWDLEKKYIELYD